MKLREFACAYIPYYMSTMMRETAVKKAAEVGVNGPSFH